MFSVTGMFYVAPYVHCWYSCQTFGISSNEKHMEASSYILVSVHAEVTAVVCISLQTRIWRNVTNTQQEILFSLLEYDNITM